MPSTDQLLLRLPPLDDPADAPLHARVRHALRQLIDQDFQNGQKFFTEETLIQHLHVSQGTVRRALADLTREGLLERQVAKGTFVRKNPAPQQPPLTPQRAVGVFVPTFESSFWAAILEHLASLCRNASARLTVHSTRADDTTDKLLALLEAPPAQQSLVLLGGADAVEGLHQALQQHRYRLVAVDTASEHYTGPFVGVDNRAGMYLGVDHLVALGHRHIALLANEPASLPSIAMRITAFKERTAEHGILGDILDCGTQLGQNAFDAAYARATNLLASPARPSAVFACSDSGAWAVLKAAAERSVRVPRDLSVIGFDDDRPSRFTQPALTTVAQPVEAIAQAALDLLWQPHPRLPHRLLLPKLAVRDSTAAPLLMSDNNPWKKHTKTPQQ